MPFRVGSLITLSVEFRRRSDDALVDPTTVALTLTDPSGSSSSLTPLVNPSVGVYTYTLDTSGFDAGSYEYKFVGSGAVVATIEDGFFLNDLSVAYATSDELDQIYGKSNVDKWADLENNGEPEDILTRRQWALSSATDEVNGRLRGGPYSVPFAKPYPRFVVRTVALLAGVLLYESRGIQDVDPETGRAIHRLSWHRKEADKNLRRLHAGHVELVTTEPIEITRYPRAVNASD